MKHRIKLPIKDYRKLLEQQASIFHKDVRDWSNASIKVVMNSIAPENRKWIKRNYTY